MTIANLAQNYLSHVIKLTYDSKFSLALLALSKLRELGHSPNTSDMAYLISGSILISDNVTLLSLLLEASVRHINLDVSTYIHLLSYCH